jgi:hypothetical protein
MNKKPHHPTWVDIYLLILIITLLTVGLLDPTKVH